MLSTRFMVGVEDEESGELTLHESGHAYALRQSVSGREDIVEDHAMEGLEWKQRRDALVNQFGSKKKKAAIKCVQQYCCMCCTHGFVYLRILSSESFFSVLPIFLLGEALSAGVAHDLRDVDTLVPLLLP